MTVSEYQICGFYDYDWECCTCSSLDKWYADEPIEDTELYKYACTYMALTELYDRRFVHVGNPYDSTESFIVHSDSRKLSN